MMGRISTSSRYMIDVTAQDMLSLGELGEFRCFGEFGASGRARMV